MVVELYRKQLEVHKSVTLEIMQVNWSSGSVFYDSRISNANTNHPYLIVL